MSAKCYTHYMHLFKVEGAIHQEIFIPVRCKSWDCLPCRQVKARLVMDFIKRSFASKPLIMLTFTVYHRGKALSAWQSMGSKWNVIRTWMVKKYPGIKYCRVIEPHKKGGWPHMHVLVDQPVSEPAIRSRLESWGFGYIYDQTKFDVQGAAQYLSGYLTKKWPDGLANQFRRLTKTRIVQASQSLGPIFQRVSSWKSVKQKISLEDLKDYVWDVYKQRFINSSAGCRVMIESESYSIESLATKEIIEKYIFMSTLPSALSVETVESPGLRFCGEQQTLIIPA